MSVGPGRGYKDVVEHILKARGEVGELWVASRTLHGAQRVNELWPGVDHVGLVLVLVVFAVAYASFSVPVELIDRLPHSVVAFNSSSLQILHYSCLQRAIEVS